MKRFFCILVLSACMPVSAGNFAATGMAEDDIYPACHAHAMIGFDSVINSRLGVPAELALEVTRINHDISIDERDYMLELLTTMMTAYLWQDTPGDFYVEVFNQCLDKATG